MKSDTERATKGHLQSSKIFSSRSKANRCQIVMQKPFIYKKKIRVIIIIYYNEYLHRIAVSVKLLLSIQIL